MCHGISLSKTQCPMMQDEQDLMSKIPYASTIGSIMYAMLCTRSDVSYALCMTSRYHSCSDPRALLNPISESEPKPRGRPFYLFLFTFYYVFFFKSVTTRIPGPTRMADPNWSPVYFDVFIYLIKTFYYVISLRKRFQFWASP